MNTKAKPEQANDWQLLTDWITQSANQLPLRYQELQDRLRENGATFSPGQPQQRQLDLLPWLISETDWQQLENGIAQRHRLLSLVLHDLYGEQRLLQAGIIPPEVIFQNRHYLLPCHQLQHSPELWLPMLASDIGQDAAGNYCVYADSSLLPGGLGYVLEHRLAFNHSTTELNNRLRKAQLAGFFRQLQQLLQHRPKAAELSGLAGILTHARRDAAYFEQAFLANYLDIALIHGADLMFRHNRLWLKTLSGLQPVDSLLRYLPDDSCDPLELLPDGIGCAGMLQSLRQQQLFCINPPGTTLLDSGVLLPFMEQICQFMLNEKLQLPVATTLWCAEQNSLTGLQQNSSNAILSNLHDGKEWLLPSLNEAERHNLLLQVQQQPELYLARELLPLQQLPCWDKNQQEHQQYGVLRLFSLQSQQQKITVLPGALGRVNSQPALLQTPFSLSQSNSFTAKDVWVLADKGQDISLLQSTRKRILLSRRSNPLPSRVADHLFWLGRYNERLNLICRALRAAIPLQAELPDFSQRHDAGCLLRFCLLANGGFMPQGVPDQQTISHILSQLFSVDNPQGVIAILKNLLFNAQSVREYFSEDTWYVLDKLQSVIYQWPAAVISQQAGSLLRALDDVILLQTAIYGLNHETMSRTHTLRFMDIGQHLERGLQTITLLQTAFIPQSQPGLLHSPPAAASATLMEAVLRMEDTLMTYRRRYRTELHPLAVIDLLLLDESTPRSVSYQCAHILQQVQQLPRPGHPDITLSREQRLAIEMVSLTQLADPDTLFDDHQLATPQLTQLLTQLQQLLKQLSDSITLSYFNHAEASSRWQSF